MNMLPRTVPPQPGKTDNPLYVSFRNPGYVGNMLNAETALDYFCHASNTFYDTQSNNQQLKMQNITRPIEECLLGMLGIQYSLWHSQPPLFIICKQIRNSATNVTPLAYYYIVNGNVHQAPDMYSIVQSRLLGALEPLRNAFQEVTNYSRFNTAKGYHWEFKNKPSKKNVQDDDKNDHDDLEDVRATNFQKTRTAQLMAQLIDEMPPREAIEQVVENPNGRPFFELPSTFVNPPATTETVTPEPVFAEPTGRVSKH